MCAKLNSQISITASSHLPCLHLGLRADSSNRRLAVLEEFLPDSLETVLVYVLEFVAALSALLLRHVAGFFWCGLVEKIPTISDSYALHYFNINFI